MAIDPKDLELLRRDKYDNDSSADMAEDAARLEAGEPLAYVIGWIPFLGCKIFLDSRPLIPRPETEQWTEELIAHLRVKFGNEPFTLLDLCAGSGAIGIAVLKHLPNAQVAFGELEYEHCALIEKNILANSIDLYRTDIRESDLFEAFDTQYRVIVCNPPYIPESRELDDSVVGYEPRVALFAGNDGLSVIRRVCDDAFKFLTTRGEIWIECDISNIEGAAQLLTASGAETTIHADHYGRDRYIVGQF